MILDFGGLSQVPDVATAQALVDGLRSAGVLPVALAYGTSAIDLLSQQLGLPLLAKFRAQYERAEAEQAPPPPHRNRAGQPVPSRNQPRQRRWPRWPTPPRRNRAACSWATCVRASSCTRKTAT